MQNEKSNPVALPSPRCPRCNKEPRGQCTFCGYVGNVREFSPSPAPASPDLHIDVEYIRETLEAAGFATCGCAMLGDDAPCQSCRVEHSLEILKGIAAASPAPQAYPSANDQVAIREALACANGRWEEWGGRAESVRDILEAALAAPAASSHSGERKREIFDPGFAAPAPSGETARQIARRVLENCARKFCNPDTWNATDPQSVIDQQIENAAKIIEGKP